MVRKKNQLWMYYNVISNNEATCKLCQRTIKTSGNTSNMIKHLRLRHPTYTGAVNAIKDYIKNETEQNQIPNVKDEIYQPDSSKEESLPYTDDTTTLENSTTTQNMELLSTAAMDADAAVEEEAEGETDLIVYAPVPESEDSIGNVYEVENMFVDEHNTYIKQSNETTELSIEQGKVDKKLLQFICKDNQPLEVVDGEGFRQLFAALCPHRRLLSSSELKIVQERQYEHQLLRTREQLGALHSLSFSCEIWTHTRSSVNFLDINIHYLEDGAIKSRFLTTVHLHENYTASDIVKCLKKTCLKFNIEHSRIVSITTENSLKLIGAARNFVGAERHVCCFAKTLKSILETATTLDVFQPLLQKVRGIVKYFQVNPQYADVLVTSQLESPLALILDNTENAFSFYYMMERYIKLAPTIHKILASQQHTSLMPLTRYELDTLKAIIKVFAPIECIICEISKEHFLPLSKYLALIFTLSCQMRKSTVSNKTAAQVYLFLSNKIVLHFGNLENHILTATACLLDPRFKSLPFTVGEHAAHYIEDLCEQYREFYEGDQAAQSSNCTFDFWSQYRTCAKEKTKKQIEYNNGGGESGGSSSDFDNEVLTFFNADVSALKSCAALQWSDMRTTYPFLYQKAIELLHIPATSIPAEFLFTETGVKQYNARQHLEKEQFDQSYFLRDCSFKDWNA